MKKRKTIGLILLALAATLFFVVPQVSAHDSCTLHNFRYDCPPGGEPGCYPNVGFKCVSNEPDL